LRGKKKRSRVNWPHVHAKKKREEKEKKRSSGSVKRRRKKTRVPFATGEGKRKRKILKRGRLNRSAEREGSESGLILLHFKKRKEKGRRKKDASTFSGTEKKKKFISF